MAIGSVTHELTHVKPERQTEILGLMESCNDYSTTFAKGLVLKTPAAKRAKGNGARNVRRRTPLTPSFCLPTSSPAQLPILGPRRLDTTLTGG